METLPYLYYKGTNSRYYGLYIKEKGVYKGAARDLSYISVAGHSGDLIIDNGRYKNVSIPYKLELVNTTAYAFEELSRAINKWLLSEPGYFKLWDSYDPDYYRLASYSGEVNIEQELRQCGTLDITFNCKPYKYAKSGDNSIGIETSAHINNPEAYSCEPYIKLYGSGNLQLHVNGKTYHFNDVDEYVEVDSESKNCYKGATDLNNKMVADGFPELVPGDNFISRNASVTRIEIIPRWRTI